MECPIPIQTENFIEVFVTPSPPADTRLSPPLPACEQGTDLHLSVIAHFTEGTTGVTHPKVFDPAGQHGIDLRNQQLGRGCTPMPDYGRDVGRIPGTRRLPLSVCPPP